MYAGTHLQRFERGIYLTYVALHYDRNFKRVSAEVFKSKLSNFLNTKADYTFNPDNIYRTADRKEMWFAKGNRLIGEIWIETDPDTKAEVRSYWMNTEVAEIN